MRTTVMVCALLGTFCGLGLGPVSAQPKSEEEWKGLTIGDEVGYVMPDELARSLGLPREDIADEENAATCYIEAINALPALDWEDDELSEQYDAALDAPWSAAAGEFFAWFQATEEARRLFRKAARMEKCQFPVMVDQPGETFLFNILMPHLAGLRGLSRLMVIEGHLREHEGRVKEALDAYLVVFRAGRHSRRERTLIAGLVGIALHAIATEAVTDCLARHDVGGDVLEGLAGELAGADSPVRDRSTWIAGERAMGLQVARMSPAELVALEGGALAWSESERAFADSRACRIVWPDRTICRDFESFYDKLGRLAQMPTWEAADALEGFDEDTWFKDWNVLAWMLAPAISRAMGEYTRAAVRHDALRINVALRRFRAETGEYPETLDELAPAYLEELPPDPFTGEPFHYVHEDGGWLLYSVGRDRDDDGGQKDDYDEGDIAYWSDGREGQEQ